MNHQCNSQVFYPSNGASAFGEVPESLVPQKQAVLFKNTDIEHLALMQFSFRKKLHGIETCNKHTKYMVNILTLCLSMPISYKIIL